MVDVSTCKLFWASIRCIIVRSISVVDYQRIYELIVLLVIVVGISNGINGDVDAHIVSKASRHIRCELYAKTFSLEYFYEVVTCYQHNCLLLVLVMNIQIIIVA